MWFINAYIVTAVICFFIHHVLNLYCFGMPVCMMDFIVRNIKLAFFSLCVPLAVVTGVDLIWDILTLDNSEVRKFRAESKSKRRRKYR